MFERFTSDARAVVLAAADEAAVSRGDRHIGTEHLLVGVIRSGNEVARAAGLTLVGIRVGLDQLDRISLDAVGIPLDPSTIGAAPAAAGRRWWLPAKATGGQIPFTSGAKDRLKACLHLAIENGTRSITGDHILAALAGGDDNDPAVRLLRTIGVDVATLESDALAALSRLLNELRHGDGLPRCDLSQ